MSENILNKTSDYCHAISKENPASKQTLTSIKKEGTNPRKSDHSKKRNAVLDQCKFIKLKKKKKKDNKSP